MKTLYLVGGPMGVGKTSVCQLLKRRLDRCAFLDGDWCWDMDPFVVNDETKEMVLDNICFVLDRFLHCTEFENVVFCWVLTSRAFGTPSSPGWIPTAGVWCGRHWWRRRRRWCGGCRGTLPPAAASRM